MASEDSKTFDLQNFLGGRTYPERVIPVMVDEKLQVAYAELVKAHANEIDSEKLKELDEAIEKMRESFKDLVLLVTVRGVPPRLIEQIQNEIHEEFPPKTNAFGKEIASTEAVLEYDLRLWNAHIVKVEAPDGTFSVPDTDDIRDLRDGLPEASLVAIGNAIVDLQTDASLGYETAVTDLGFLSTP